MRIIAGKVVQLPVKPFSEEVPVVPPEKPVSRRENGFTVRTKLFPSREGVYCEDKGLSFGKMIFPKPNLLLN